MDFDGIEEWRTCTRDSDYEVSNMGRVRSWKRLKVLYLKLRFDIDGYPYITVHSGGRRQNVKIHVLVAEAFLGARPKGQVCRHLNDIKTDNRLINLRWGTRQENEADKKRNGGQQLRYGMLNPATKLSDEAIAIIRETYIPGCNQYNIGNARILAARFDITREHIAAIARGARRNVP